MTPKWMVDLCRRGVVPGLALASEGRWYFKHPQTGEVTPWREFVVRQRVAVGSWVETDRVEEAVVIGASDGMVQCRYEATGSAGTMWVLDEVPIGEVTWKRPPDKVSAYVLRLRGAYGRGIDGKEPKSSEEIYEQD